MPRRFDVYLQERRARIACWMTQRKESNIVIGIFERWVHDLADNGCEPHSRDDLLTLPLELSLVTRLSEGRLGAYSDALAWQVAGGEGIEPAEAPLVGHALAVASGRAYVAYGPSKLGWIGHLVSTIDSLAWEAFADSAADALREDSSRLREFLEFLTAIIEEANSEPDRVIHFPPRQTSMASLVEQFARVGGFQEVWEADRWPVLFRWSDVFEILRRADPERFLMLVGELPHPTLVKQCLSSKSLKQNPSEVLRLLRLADASFDAEGQWHCRGMAAILLLQLASDQLFSAACARDEREQDASFTKQGGWLAAGPEAHERDDLEEGITQFREAAGRLLDILFARSDCIELGWHWLENLLRQVPPRLPPDDGRQARKLMINHIGILVHGVSSRLAPRPRRDAWIADAKPPLFRQYRAVAVLSVAAFSSAVSDLDVGAVALGLLKHHSFELTRPNELIQLPAAPLRTVPGDALARIPNIASWFTDSWSASRFVREQAWRRRGGTNPAEILAIWGLGVIESLQMNIDSQQDNARAMWVAVEVAFREARLVEPRMGRDFWFQAVAHLFWWWPRVVASTPGHVANSEQAAAVDPAMLSRTLAPYIGISSDFMAIAVSLQLAGVHTMQLDCAVREARHDLLRMIRRFLETARGLTDTRSWNQQWVAALRGIELAIAALRSANEFAVQGAVRTPTGDATRSVEL
jgi:hypothetical protein